MWEVVQADILDWAAEYQGKPFAAILCDPPYGLEFMGKEWDRFQGYTTDIDFKGFTLPRQRQRNIKCPDCDKYVYDHEGRACTCGGVKRAQMRAYEQFCYDWVCAIIPHLLPGGFIMAFGGNRTFHRLACAMEDAGLVLNSTVFLWAQGSGFPKATNIHAQLEKRLCHKKGNDWYYKDDGEPIRTDPPFRHPDADKFYGHRYGTQCLKPSVEPIIVAQKPWEGKRLDCIVETGAGALNIEKARITLSSHNREHDVVSCKRCSSLGIQVLNGTFSVLPESSPDFLYSIASALHCYNSDGKDQGRNASDQGDSQTCEHFYAQTVHDRLYPNGVWCGLDLTLILNSQSDCRFYPHSHDARSHEIQEAAQGGAPLLAGVLERICRELSEPSHNHESSNDRPSNGDDLGLLSALANLLVSRFNTIIPYTKHLVKSGRPARLHPGGEEGLFGMGSGITGGRTSQGRWPANFVLCHSEGCERVGMKRVKSSIGWRPHHSHGDGQIWGSVEENQERTSYADPNGMETVDAWECVPECPARKLGEQSGQSKSIRSMRGDLVDNRGDNYGRAGGKRIPDSNYMRGHNDKGTCARFFFQADWSHEMAERIAGADPVRYQPKAAKRERNQNLDDFYWRKDKKAPIGFVRIDKDEWEALGEEEERIYEETSKRISLRAQGNIHSTVKPISLCKHLATLLLLPSEYAPRRILIPFCGTMSEGIGAMLAGWEEIVGIDSEQEYCDIAEVRMRFWQTKMEKTDLSEPKAILKTCTKKVSLTKQKTDAKSRQDKLF